MKRLFDFLVSVLLLLLLLPFFIVIGCLVRKKLGKPVIFKQLRTGTTGCPFYIYKFRTMIDTRYIENSYLEKDRRITPLGRFLRKYSLDELPQLFNVLKGELSLVGPRPLLAEYLPLYTPEQARRHDVKPGITGWAQVNGRNSLSWEEKFKLDVWYVDHQSFFLDLKILCLTVKKVVRSEGINQSDSCTMPRFMGEEANGRF